jgi:uncharacterized protein
MDIVEEVRKFVETESKKPTSKYGYEPYQFHFIPMVKYAQELAEMLVADKEIVTIAGWMHDIGAVVEGRKDHHISGARIAEAKLRELNYPEDKIEKVKNCILNHRGSVDNMRESLEEKIIAEADALSNFENIGGLFKAAYEFENLNQQEAQESVKAKLQRKYNKLHFEQSKEIIKPKYDAAMLLLG